MIVEHIIAIEEGKEIDPKIIAILVVDLLSDVHDLQVVVSAQDKQIESLKLVNEVFSEELNRVDEVI